MSRRTLNLDDSLLDYLQAHSLREHPAQRALRAATDGHPAAGMQIAPEQGQFMAMLVRLIGGESYWPYGLAALQQLARDRNIVLAVLPADGRDDIRLDAYSTLPVSTLRRLKVLCDTGGPVAAQAAIAQLALASGLYGGPVIGEQCLQHRRTHRSQCESSRFDRGTDQCNTSGWENLLRLSRRGRSRLRLRVRRRRRESRLG